MRTTWTTYSLSSIQPGNPGQFYIDGISAILTITKAPDGTMIDAIAGSNWRVQQTDFASNISIVWPVVYLNGSPVPYDQRLRIVAASAAQDPTIAGTLIIIRLVP